VAIKEPPATDVGTGLVLRHISKSFANGAGQHPALQDINLIVPDGSFVVLLGPSGCGKSTLLRIIAGIERADQVNNLELTLNNRPIEGPSPDRGLVFQAYSSFPWLTVRQNILFGLRLTHRDNNHAAEIAERYLRLVGLADHGDFYPRDLSGGQQQRVALARTLVLRPALLLMDEPYAALDTFNRERQQSELLRIWRETQATVIFVTHDIAEAVFLGTRILVMSQRPGRIVADINVEEMLQQRLAGHPDSLPTSLADRGAWLRERAEYYDLVATLKRTLPASDAGSSA
jgi:NitT/TauT family transport system ATP-binding protein